MDEVYLVDLATGLCTPQPRLRTPRMAFASARMPDGRIIVAGGLRDGGNAVITTAEVWEPSRGARRALPGMGTPRHRCCGCMLSDGRFAVLGGRNGYGTAHASCEALILDNGAERWEPLPPMLEARAGFACAAVGGCVIAAGGCGIGGDLSSAEVFEEATGEWRRLPCNMPRAVSYMGSAVL